MTAAARVSARLSSVVFTVATLAILAGCGGSTETSTPVVVKDVTPATIVPSSTDTLRAVVGTAAGGAVSVIVKNKAGELIDSALVTFTVTAGGGAVGNQTVRTVAGQASTTWTLGQTVGLQTLTATTGGITATFNAIASASTAATITKIAGDLQTVAVGTNVPVSPSVKVTDKFGNPVAGALVTFSVASGGGLANGGAVNTGADGLATLSQWRLGTVAGLNTLTAGTGALSVTFTATATAGAVAALSLTPNTIGQLTPTQTVQLTAKAVDASGNVIANPALTWTSSNSSAATVSASGLVTAVGAGTATISVSSGSLAAASVSVAVIGHPSTTTLSAPLSVAPGIPGDLAFSSVAMHVAVPSLSRVLTFDATGTVQTGLVQLTTPVQFLLAPHTSPGPIVAINPSTSSRMWFIDPTASAVIDSVDVPEFVKSANMSQDGSRIYLMLSDGSLAIYDGIAHNLITRLQLGGGVTATKLSPGDTLLYAVTNVGVIFKVDVRTSAVSQVIANAVATDFAIGSDGLFYLMDGTAGLVKLFNPVTNSIVRTVVVSPSGTSIAVTPDAKQFWIGHSTSQITIYTGSPASGYIAGGTIPTLAQPIRIYFSPTGSFAAITSFGGWVDIVR